MSSDRFQFKDEIPLQPAGEGIKRQIMGYDETVMMVKVIFEKGAVGAMHSHPHRQVTYVESGAFDMTIGDDTKLIKTGDGYFVPPDIMHGVTCLEAGVLIDVFTPVRADFLS